MADTEACELPSDEEFEDEEDGEDEEDEEMVVNDEVEDSDLDDDEEKTEKRVYLPGDEIAEGEELVCGDESAYVLYHQAQTGAPCLSFDILRDSLGDERETLPHTVYMAAGTQADRALANNIIVMRMHGLHKTKGAKNDSDDEDESSDDDEEQEEPPKLEVAMMKHNGGVNRLRSTVMGEKQLAATWSESGRVNIYDLSQPLHAVNDSQAMKLYKTKQSGLGPIFKFAGHQSEGFALDWSPTVEGRLASGDCIKNIHLWTPQEGGSWQVDQRPCTGHTASVEDIQWSPNEANVFSSCSVDKSIRIWDTRQKPSKSCMLTVAEAHDRDVNVISWNRKEPFIVSGGDDGILKVWDLRQFQKGKPVATFKHHAAPITSVEWHPTDSTVFTASGSDDQITLWDLAVEKDDEGTVSPATSSSSGEAKAEPSVPPQLLFIHQGQKDIKELHWHPQIPGLIISTASSGFNIFRTISV